MTDSVALFPLGYRFEDPQGVPYSGATVEFYDANTTNPKTVYADKDLTVELGTSITTDSAGRPTSDGSTPTDVYVGTASYKYVLNDADGVEIETKDNRPGAVVSASSVDVSVTATFPVETKSLDYAILSTDQNTLFVVNCSSGDVALTLPSATDDDIPNGFKIKVQHAGSANQAIIEVASGSGQLISEGTKSFGGSFALPLNGEECEFVADGGNWRVSSHTLPFPKVAVLPIVDRVSTSPSSPQAGAYYLLTGIGGDFSTFTSGDIVQYTGAGWVNWTPYTDCGWIAYVADENQYYTYQDSAWVGATVTNAGMVTLANTTEMEAATEASKVVTPARQQAHPGHPKMWGYASVSGGSPSLGASYNLTSITDGGVGTLQVTIATDFSSANWPLVALLGGTLSRYLRDLPSSRTAGSFAMVVTDTQGDADDPGAWHWCGLGDQ